MIEAVDVSTGWQRLSGMVRQRLLAVPPTVAPTLLNKRSVADVAAVLEAALYHAMQDLADAGEQMHATARKPKARE